MKPPFWNVPFYENPDIMALPWRVTFFSASRKVSLEIAKHVLKMSLTRIDEDMGMRRMLFIIRMIRYEEGYEDTGIGPTLPQPSI